MKHAAEPLTTWEDVIVELSERGSNPKVDIINPHANQVRLLVGPVLNSLCTVLVSLVMPPE